MHACFLSLIFLPAPAALGGHFCTSFFDDFFSQPAVGLLRGAEDFGEIVFNMVEHGVLSKTDTDSRKDFQGGYDFEKAFRAPFQPSSRGV